MATQFMPVRVLYTLDSATQYMLSRTPNSAPVILIHSAIPSIAYGKTRLETCIQAINRSSPELFSDDEHDYSIYLLDPLESQQRNCAFTSASTSSAPPHFTGVAVGLGLLSALSTPNPSEEVFATGTISTSPDGVGSLEVVFNLKEMKRRSKAPAKQTKKRTTATKKQDHKTAPSPNSRSYPLSSQAGLHPSTVVNVQERHRHYPPKVELYSSLPTDSVSFNNHYPYQRSSSLPQLPMQHPPPSCQSSSSYSSLQSVQNSPSQTNSLQSLLSALSSAENTDAVLSMLSLIDAQKSFHSQSSQPLSCSSQDNVTSPVLSETLRKLLLAAASAQSSTPINPIPQAFTTINDLPTSSSFENTPTPSSTPIESPSDAGGTSNDEVIVVNKENVDPAVSSKKSIDENEKQIFNRDFRPLFLSSPPRSRPSVRSISVSANDPATVIKRKRTLSEIMDEKDQQGDNRRGSGEAGQNEDKQTVDLEQVRKRLLYLSSQTQSDPNYGSDFNSFKSTGWATAKAKNARLIAVTGSRMTPVAINHAGTKKRFVVPDWAKTDTATVPRLSEEAATRMSAMELERNATAKSKANKVKQDLGGRKRKLTSTSAKGQSEENTGYVQSEPAVVNRKPTTPQRKTKAAKTEMSNFPLVAISSPAIFNSSPLASHSRGSAMMMPPKTPKTPTRRRNRSLSGTPKRNNTRATSLSPLFTPGSGSCATPKLPSLFNSCSPLLSNGIRGRSSPPEIIRSSRTAEDEDELLNSLPGASSDVEDGSPMKILSSSPPPSSPILTSSDDENLQIGVLNDLNSQEDGGVAPNALEGFGLLTNANTCAAGQPQAFDMDAAELIEFVNGTRERTCSGPSTGDDLTEDARLAAEIFSWTSADGSGGGDGFQLGEFWKAVEPLMEQGGGGMGEIGGGVRLANEMVDLFGGCLM